MKIHKKITFILKTFNRHLCLQNCLQNIRFLNTSIPIIIADDSLDFIKLKNKNLIKSFTNCIYIPLSYNSGLSKGRNIMVSQVKTPYIFLLDDDNYITELENTIKIIHFLDNFPMYQLVGGICVDRKMVYNEFCITYSGLFKKIEKDNIFLKPNEEKIKNIFIDNIYKTHICLNLFIARTSILKEFKWDEKLKLGEHEVFFYNLYKNNIKIAICYDFNIREITDERRNYLKSKRNIHLSYKRTYNLIPYKN